MNKGSISKNLGEQLARERERLFVGRSTEFSEFSSMLENKSPIRIAVISGPGGIGKSLLIEQLLSQAQRRKIPTAYIDALLLQEVTPRNLQATLTETLPKTGNRSQTNILFIDNIEHIGAMADWIRQQLPSLLPISTRLIMAGRWQPPVSWYADSAFASMLTHWPLSTLPTEQVQQYLKRRGLNKQQQESVADFSHGHPLAMALSADQLLRSKTQSLQGEQTDNLIKRLIECLFSDIEYKQYQCLEVAASLHFINEPLLQTMMPSYKAATLYKWLANQPFMQYRAEGLLMHELVRTVIIDDLRRRNLQRHHELIRRASHYYLNSLNNASPEIIHAALNEALHTLRWEPYIAFHFDVLTQSYYLDEVNKHELPLLSNIVEQYEGHDAAKWFRFWCDHGPAQLATVRDQQGKPVGVMLALVFDYPDLQKQYDDPAVNHYISYLNKHSVLDENSRAFLMRFVMAEQYQRAHPSLSQIAMHMHSLVFTPALGHFAMVCDQKQGWEGVSDNANIKPIKETRFKTELRELVIRGLDLKPEPPLVWVRNTTERILGNRFNAHTEPTKPSILSQTSFTEALLNALQNFNNDHALSDNPLLQSQCLQRHSDEHPSVVNLRELIQQATRSLDDIQPNTKLSKVLSCNYFESDSKQITAAASLNISESTFRRHLREAEKYLCDHLWGHEINRDQLNT